MTPAHLDQKDDFLKNTSLYEKAIYHIKMVEKFKTPRDKLVSVLNTCKLVSSMVWAAARKGITGADDFLPVLVYLVVKAKPARPVANVAFILDFVNSDKLAGLDEYYFTAYSSAVDFL